MFCPLPLPSAGERITLIMIDTFRYGAHSPLLARERGVDVVVFSDEFCEWASAITPHVLRYPAETRFMLSLPTPPRHPLQHPMCSRPRHGEHLGQIAVGIPAVIMHAVVSRCRNPRRRHPPPTPSTPRGPDRSAPVRPRSTTLPAISGAIGSHCTSVRVRLLKIASVSDLEPELSRTGNPSNEDAA
jgi:hypothetical protein